MFKLFQRFRKWSFPKKIEKPESVQRLLKTIYPNVNWKKVHFYEGLPWFTSLFSSHTSAIALPGRYSFDSIHIYFKDFEADSPRGLEIIVHEAFHALQYTDIGTKGVGWIRLFMIQYLACCLQLGKNCYAKHPMEKQAYAHQHLFAHSISDLGNDFSLFLNSEEIFKNWIKQNPHLIKTTSEFEYKCGNQSSFLATLLVILIALAVLLFDILFFLTAIFLSLLFFL